MYLDLGGRPFVETQDVTTGYAGRIPMPTEEIRFAVASRDGLRAATWKCWSPPGKSDVYLACRELRGAFKTSLHESGRWHVAYLQEFFEAKVDAALTTQGRFIEKWERPTQIAPGITLAYRIVTPWSSCTTKQTLPASVYAVEPPGEGRAIEFDFLIVDAGVPVTGWPAKNQGTALVGSYQLANGASLFVVWWEIAMPTLAAFRGAPNFYKGKDWGDLEAGNLRSLQFGTESDGSKVIYDCVVRYEARNG